MTEDEYIQDGESFTWNPRTTILRLVCCDCALMHELNFKVLPSGELKMTVTRLDRQTAQRRRRHKAGLFEPGGNWVIVRRKKR